MANEERGIVFHGGNCITFLPFLQFLEGVANRIYLYRGGEFVTKTNFSAGSDPVERVRAAAPSSAARLANGVFSVFDG